MQRKQSSYRLLRWRRPKSHWLRVSCSIIKTSALSENHKCYSVVQAYNEPEAPSDGCRCQLKLLPVCVRRPLPHSFTPILFPSLPITYTDCSSYLQSQSHSLGYSCLRENGLNMGHQLTGQPAALRANQLALLLNAGDHSKVQREVSGDDAADPLLLQLLMTFQVCRHEGVKG